MTNEQQMRNGATQGIDGKWRTPWANSEPLLTTYYDTEWGIPVRDEQGLFERLCLEAFQAGLSWLTVLKKREALRTRFFNFDVDSCGALTDAQLEDAMSDVAIVRNRLKVNAVRKNAIATQQLRGGVGLAEFIWSFAPQATPAPIHESEVPTTSPESIALAKALKKQGFVFVGPTTVYALMEAVGMVDTHVLGSFRRNCSGIWT